MAHILNSQLSRMKMFTLLHGICNCAWVEKEHEASFGWPSRSTAQNQDSQRAQSIFRFHAIFYSSGRVVLMQ